MNSLINKISSKYIFQRITAFIPLDRTIKIFMYNKSCLNKLNFNRKDAINILLMAKLIKPIANMEDYLPILKKICCSSNNYITNLFCKYLNFNNKFIPSFTFKSKNEEILDLLNNVKICFNSNLVGSFYDDEMIEFDDKLFLEYNHKYAEKIKEISFMDNSFSEKDKKETLTKSLILIKFLLLHSKINKIEDRYFDYNDNSTFLDLLNSKYDIEYYQKMYNNIYKEKKIDKNINEIICELKSYSIYFDNYNSKVIRAICDNILISGKNIE